MPLTFNLFTGLLATGTVPVGATVTFTDTAVSTFPTAGVTFSFSFRVVNNSNGALNFWMGSGAEPVSAILSTASGNMSSYSATFSFAPVDGPTPGPQSQFLNGTLNHIESVVGTVGWAIKSPGAWFGSTGTIPGQNSSVKFCISGGNGITAIGFYGFEVQELNCFAAGTLIATQSGQVAVETLKPGDLVVRADGAATVIQWLGVQTINPQVLHPAKVNPICIAAGAIAENVPSRDLHVSPDHAIEIDGLLINASALVNGSTIYQVKDIPLDGFTYYHVETEAHELILAENCPAESYLDMPSREMFDNGAERADGPVIQEMDLPRISSARLVPAEIACRLANTKRAA